MADYKSALNTSLGDYLSFRASQEGTTRGELEKSLIIEPIKVEAEIFLGCAGCSAIKKFDIAAREYSAIVELREGLTDVGILGLFGTSYSIRGTGIRKK